MVNGILHQATLYLLDIVFKLSRFCSAPQLTFQPLEEKNGVLDQPQFVPKNDVLYTCVYHNLCQLLIVKNKHMNENQKIMVDYPGISLSTLALNWTDQLLNLSTTELNSDGTIHPRWDMVRWALLKTKSDSDRASRMILAVPGTLIIPQFVPIICPSNGHFGREWCSSKACRGWIWGWFTSRKGQDGRHGSIPLFWHSGGHRDSQTRGIQSRESGGKISMDKYRESPWSDLKWRRQHGPHGCSIPTCSPEARHHWKDPIPSSCAFLCCGLGWVDMDPQDSRGEVGVGWDLSGWFRAFWNIKMSQNCKQHRKVASTILKHLLVFHVVS